jgi:hypothetical protein
MQTVNFPCTHCGKLMAVGENLIGQWVRCPHCQQVLQAPITPAPVPAVSAPATPPSQPSAEVPQEVEFQFAPPPKDDDSIFGQTPVFSDDLFGAPSERPTVEIPLEAGWPPIGSIDAGAVPPVLGEPLQTPMPPFIADLAFTPPAVVQPIETSPFPPLDNPWPAPSTDVAEPRVPSEELAPPVPSALEETSAAEALAPPPSFQPRALPQEGGLFIPTLLIFLIPYAVFVTIVAGYLYFLLKRVPDPLEFLPDRGDNPGATRKAGAAVERFKIIERFPPDRNLPARLHVALGKSIDIGDLRVHPTSIQQRQVTFCSERAGTAPVPSQDDALVLTMQLKNISTDVYFAPTDAAFYSSWKETEPATSKPYTFVEAGSKRFYGGPFKWRPRGGGEGYRDPDPREYVQGQENDAKVLKPGEERQVTVCTDPEKPEVLRAVKRYPDAMVWRVQLRRGLVTTGDGEVSVSAVIGVDFRAADIH